MKTKSSSPPLLDGGCDPAGHSLLHAAPVDVVAAEDRGQDDHQDRAVEGPVAERRIRTHKLAGSGFRVKDAIYAILVVRVVLAAIEHALPVIVGDRIGHARDDTARISIDLILKKLEIFDRGSHLKQTTSG